jgi:hypothetical protein
MADSDSEVDQKKGKGGQKGWSTPEQTAWLDSLVPSFQKAQAGGFRKLAEFWPGLFEEWFIRWPGPSTVMPSGDNDEAIGATDATDAITMARKAEHAKAVKMAVDFTKAVSVVRVSSDRTYLIMPYCLAS